LAEAHWSRTFLNLTLKTVPRRKDQDGFAVLAKRWRVERAISWIMRARRNVRDYERLISHSEAHLTWTFITLMTRRLTRPPRPPRAAPHPVEPVTVGKPRPIRLRTQPQTILLAPPPSTDPPEVPPCTWTAGVYAAGVRSCVTSALVSSGVT
jgi:hypothetical protein